MACFCGCETWQKNDDGFRVACVKCGHGPELAAELRPTMDKGENPQLAADNAYLLLFQCYEALSMFREANEVLDRIKIYLRR